MVKLVGDMYYFCTFFVLLLAGYVLCTSNTTTTEPEPYTITPDSNKTTTFTTSTTSTPSEDIPTFYVKRNNEYCLLLQTNMELKIDYYNTKNDLLTQHFAINSTNWKTSVKSTNGTCSDSMANITLIWHPTPTHALVKSAHHWNLSVVFAAVDGKWPLFGQQRASSGAGDDAVSNNRLFELTNITLNYYQDEANFPDTNETLWRSVSVNSVVFVCPFGSYFACERQQTLSLTGVTRNSTPVTNTTKLPSRQQDVVLMVDHLRSVAFGNATEKKFFGTRRDCLADSVPSKAVPIAVGVALAVVILIALTVFFIGNRRRQRAYERI